MTNKTMIAKAVKAALFGGLTASLAISAPATFAAEEEEGERIVVTGSRIKRVDVETAQPVTIISREDIDLSGDTSVAEALRNTSANSFGSWKGQSGYGAGATGAAEIDLRGVGATLVLIDGRRMPGSGYDGGATQDLNNIPLSIVERIEILRGGASAIYGSDAVAGVVNVITRKDVEGVTVSALMETPKVEGGSKRQYEFAAGASGDRGSMWVVAEHQYQEHILDSSVTGFDNGVSWYSVVPNVIYPSIAAGGTTVDYNSELCGVIPNTVDQGFRCGYAYSNTTKLYPDRDSNSIVAKFVYELTDSIEFNARLGYVQTETLSRYAPTPVSTNPFFIQQDNPNNPYAADMEPGSQARLYFRSAILGPRDARTVKDSYDLVFGLTGMLDSGYDWTLNYQRTLANELLLNRNLINDVALQQLVDNGSFDVLNSAGRSTADYSAHALANYRLAAHTGIFELEQDKNIIDGTFGGELYSDDAMTLAFVVGAEYEQSKFTQISDPESGAGFISGGSGGDDVFASRDRTALFTEFGLNFDFGLELSLAARYDKYDQSGYVGVGTADRSFSDTTPMFGVAYRPTDDILLRATYGEAFRAPTMPELFASQSFGFPSAYDYYYCDTLGNPANDTAYCNATNLPQHLTYSGGNPTLNSEKADTLTVGGVWNVTDDFVVELGYYSIEYYDKITSVSLNQILLLNQQAGGNTPSVVRGSNGQIESLQSGSVNLTRQETSGYDFAASYNFDSSIGQWNIRGDLTYVKDFGVVNDGVFLNTAGRRDLPKVRTNITTSWSNGDLFGAWRINYIGGQDRTSDSFIDIPAVMYHHLQFGVNTSWDGQFTLGVRNVTDKESPQYTDTVAWRNFNTTLYDPAGRTWFFKYEQSF